MGCAQIVHVLDVQREERAPSALRRQQGVHDAGAKSLGGPHEINGSTNLPLSETTDIRGEA